MVPMTDRSQLAPLQPLLHILGEIGALPMTFLLLVEATAGGVDRRQCQELEAVADGLSLRGKTVCPTLPEGDKVASILDRATPEDLIVMHAGDRPQNGQPVWSRLAEDLARRTDLPALLVYGDLRTSDTGRTS